MISVIVPVYNSSKYLRYCLESIMNQSYSDFEVILVDDCSNDGSEFICDEYANKYGNVSVIHHTDNKGLSMSREDGFLKSKGDYIFFMDNDDWICKNTFLHLSKFQDECDLVCIGGINSTMIENHQDENELNATDVMTNIKTYSGKEGYEKIISSKGQMVYSATWGKLYSRPLVEKALNYTKKFKGIIPWVYMEDILFLPVCFNHTSKTIFIESAMYYHRVSNDNLASKKEPKQYHYECIDAGSIAFEYLQANGSIRACANYLVGYLLNMESTWYRIFHFEQNDVRKHNALNKIERIIKKYGKYDVINKVSISYLPILIFSISPYIWEKTVGTFFLKSKYNV